MEPSNTSNCFSVDVEDYYQVSAFEDRVSRKSWGKYESRVEASTNRLLGILEEQGVLGTFFILGWIADRYPSLVQRIKAHGHEIASHGYWHKLVYTQTPEEFADDIRTSKEAIATACGVEVNTYRAPSFSIVERSLWALDILAEQGFLYDSSIFPIRGHDRYGMADALREIHDLPTEHGTITEFPPSAWSMRTFDVPIGGGYFRILPFALTLRSVRAVIGEGMPAMFYIHPWEIDPEQPRISKLKIRNRLRHYTGLQRTAERLKKLFEEFRFTTFSKVIEDHSFASSAGRDLQQESDLCVER